MKIKIPDISSLVKKSDYNAKITGVENNIKKLETFDLSYFRGNNYFDEDATQSYLIFQPIFRYFKINSVGHVIEYVLSWQSKGLSAELIKPPSTSDNSLKPKLSYYHASRIRLKFTRNCLTQDKIIFNHGKVVNIYIVYKLGASTSNIGDPTLKNCLFGAVL